MKLEVDFSNDPYQHWGTWGPHILRSVDVDGISGTVNVFHSEHEFPSVQEAEQTIHAHRMQWKLREIEKAAKKRWESFPVMFYCNVEKRCFAFDADDTIYRIEHTQFEESIQEKLNEIIRLMDGIENLEIAIRGPWR